MSGTRRSRKQSTKGIKLDIKSKKLMAAAQLAAQKKIAAEKKRKEFARKKKALMTAAKKKGVKLRTDYTALYRKKS
jgi:hypothetical protein